MWAALVRFITGDLSGKLLAAYQAKLNAANDEQRIVADVAVKDIEARIEARRQASEIRKQTSGFWEMRLITALIAGCFTLHLVLVTLDTCFKFGMGIPKFPPPFDEWQGTILLSFFGVQAIGHGFSVIAAAIRGRK